MNIEQKQQFQRLEQLLLMLIIQNMMKAYEAGCYDLSWQQYYANQIQRLDMEYITWKKWESFVP